MAFPEIELPADLPLNVPVRFEPKVSPSLLHNTQVKLSLARFPEEQEDFGPDDWSQGAKVERVRQLVQFWKTEYDWATREEAIQNTFDHYMVNLDVPDYGLVNLHFVYRKSGVQNTIPLLFCHGWPGSFLESRYVLEPLTMSAKNGGPVFDVVVPSIPGFGFSPAPRKGGVGPSVVARAYKLLMSDVLGYRDGFVTQGGDFGSFISRSLAIQYPELVIAQHLNMFPVPPPTLLSAPLTYLRWCASFITYSSFEKEALKIRRNFELDQSGYLEQQKTRPQTLGFALGDSPLGLLAWFVEKFHDWVDVEGTASLSNSDTIDLVMMHWIQGATPGLRFYREAFWGGKRDADDTFGVYVPAPTGVSMYAKEQLHCPRDWAAQAGNIVFWKEHATGGHFSSLERPEQFLQDMKDFVTTKAVKQSISHHLGSDFIKF
ncbi:epoxide hydrolase [Myriangium duriaei CBS 260.36]|uniref:Epoxide hydrolase n=1 Tax=Myriangium duriaei CBS 260.36 TaxID=1168546 RepID=A0A9P4MH31_9PEZI|nr:epoxide hydrolase [Myriangium duriaei CBS 260.36]